MPEFKADSSLKRVLNNGLFSGIQFAAYTLSGIILTPFLLKKFGGAAFGLIALAGFLTQYIGMISGCVSTSVSRFLNIALNKNNWEEANEIFSTALAGNVVIILFQIPLFILGVWKLHWIIDYPVEQAFDFKILVGCNIGVFLVSVLRGVYATPIYAANRLDLGMKFGVFFQLIRLALLFGLINWLGARLWIVGVIDLLLSLADGAVTYVFCRKLARSLVFRKKFISTIWLRPILGMAGFMLITALANSLFFKTDVWMLNRFVDAKTAGIYAALLIWPNFLTQVVSRLTALVAPTIFIDYAREDISRVLKSTLYTEKIIAFCAILAAGLFVFFGELVLSLWLGRPGSIVEVTLLTLFFVTASFSACADALWRIFQVFNKPKIPGIVALFCGVVNVALSLLLIRLGAGVYGVLAGTMVSSLLLKAIFQPWYAARLLKQSALKLWYPIIVSLIMCMISVGLKRGLCVLNLDSWYLSFVCVGAIALTGVFTLTSREERLLFFNTVRGYVYRR